MKSISPEGRSKVIDTAKGLGILAVVLGHVIAGLLSAHIIKSDSPYNIINRWMYTWHMPLFILLSGVFAHRLARKNTREFAWHQAYHLMFPYFFWGVLQTSIHVMFSSETNTQGTWQSLSELFYQPPMQFWFLYVLFIAQTAYYLSSRLPYSGWVFPLFCLGLIVTLSLNPVAKTSIPNRLRENLPLYIIGTWVSSVMLELKPAWGDFSKVSQKQWAYPSILAFACVTTLFASIVIAMLPPANQFRWPFCLIYCIPGIVCMLCLSSILSYSPVGFMLVFFGKNSFYIYLAHVIGYAGARIILQRVFGVFDVSSHLLIGMFAGCFFPLGLVFVWDRLGLGKYILFRRQSISTA